MRDTPADVSAGLPEGVWHVVHGVWMFVPDKATPEQLEKAVDALDLIFNERYVRWYADQGGT